MIKKWLKRTALLLLALLVLAMLIKGRMNATYFDRYDPATPLNAQSSSVELIDQDTDLFDLAQPQYFRRITASFESRPGEKIPVILTLPAEGEAPFPVIVFLHGIGQKKEFMEKICTPFNEAGFAMATFDQYMRGERRVEDGLVSEAVAFYHRPWKTVNDARRLIDYLETRPEVDCDRLYLVGASYGALMGCTTTAMDKRIRAAALVVGGGNLSLLMDAPAIKNEAPPVAYGLLKPVFTFMMHASDPILYAAQTAPTPLFFLNGTEDTLVTPEAGQALYDAAGEPKKIEWYPCDHPGLRPEDTPIVLEMLNDAKEWLVEQDAPFAPVTAAVATERETVLSSQ